MSTRKNSIFVPGVSELETYGRMAEPGMGPNPPRVRRDWGGSPEGQLPLRAPRSLIGQGEAGGGPSANGKRRDESHMRSALQGASLRGRHPPATLSQIETLSGQRFIIWCNFPLANTKIIMGDLHTPRAKWCSTKDAALAPRAASARCASSDGTKNT